MAAYIAAYKGWSHQTTVKENKEAREVKKKQRIADQAEIVEKQKKVEQEKIAATAAAAAEEKRRRKYGARGFPMDTQALGSTGVRKSLLGG